MPSSQKPFWVRKPIPATFITNTLFFQADSYFKRAAALSSLHGKGSLPNHDGYKRGSRPSAGVMLLFLEERKAYKFQDDTKDR